MEHNTARYKTIQQAGVLGVAYLADNDDTGRQKAQKCLSAAHAAGLPLLVVHAADVWSGLPRGGSIDDASGTPIERLQQLIEALPNALELQRDETAVDHCREKFSSELLTGPQLLAFIEKSYLIEWDQLKQRPIVNGVMPRGRDKKLFYLDISSRFPSVKAKKEEAQDVLDYIALKNSFNPIKRYFDGLKEKASRGELQLLKLDEIAVKGFGIGDDDWISKSLLAHKLVQQLKRGLTYGYKADEMFILQGKQGDLKTEAIKALVPQPDWVCTETELNDTNDWKFLLKISQSWIFLFDECDKFLRGKDSATLKSIVSNTHDSYAAKGLNEVDDHPRPSTMWGTTNESSLFNDHTGVRRWWLVRVGDRRRCDPGWIRRNRDSIWATAYTWAMWGLESYLPRGSVVEEAAKARAWGATYSLDDDGDYLQRLSAIPVDGSTDLPSPIAKSGLIKDVSDIDTKRLWQTDRKRARDLLADVTRIVTAGNSRTHDGQIRWEERKGRVPGQPNPVQAFFPIRVAAAAEQQSAAAEFQGDPIQRVPMCSDLVPIDWNGQTPWQDSVLTSLFQCSDKKEKSIHRDGGSASGPGGCGEGTPTSEKIGTLEQTPQSPVIAKGLPVPIFGSFKGTTLEQVGDPEAEVGTAASLADPQAAATPLADPAACTTAPDQSAVPAQDQIQQQSTPIQNSSSMPNRNDEGSTAPSDLLAAHLEHLKAHPIQCGSLGLGDHFNDLLGQDNSSLPVAVALSHEQADSFWELLGDHREEHPEELLPLLKKELGLVLTFEQLRALMAEHHKDHAKAEFLPLTEQDRQLQAALDQRFQELIADGSLRLNMQDLSVPAASHREAA